MIFSGVAYFRGLELDAQLEGVSRTGPVGPVAWDDLVSGPSAGLTCLLLGLANPSTRSVDLSVVSWCMAGT